MIYENNQDFDFQQQKKIILKIKIFFTQNMSTTPIHQTLYNYLAKGIIDSNIFQDGGLQCYNEIPKYHHYFFVFVLTIIHLFFFIKWKKHMRYSIQLQKATKFELRFAMLSLLSWILTAFFKLNTMKGLFMLNPCHITILIQIYLMVSENTKTNIFIYTAWTGWLFGPYMATFIPHLNGISQFQVILYYFEHIAIIPFGYLILSRRYGFLKPTLKNHLPAFSTIAFYQLLVLAPFSRLFMVNLNFALCHSPADPSFKVVGYYYFVVCTLFLNIFSYLARWFSYVQVKVLSRIFSGLGIKYAQSNQVLAVVEQQNTPGFEKTK